MENQKSKENIVKKYLDVAGLSYKQAAEKTGLSRQTIWLHATGRVKPGIKALRAYYKAFGINLEKLLK